MTYLNEIVSFFEQAVGVITSFRFADFLDICLVAFVVYSVVKLVRETRAIQLFKGILLFGVAYVVITVLEMQASTYLFRSVASNAIVCLVIIFSPEIRHVLESLGRKSLSSYSVLDFAKGSRDKKNEETNSMITEVCRSVSKMSEQKIGALIVFERKTLLGSIIETGKTVDALVTEELIGTIFFPKTPLHDGASIIRANRIVSAGCILPLTKNNEISSELGTRHRAALGMSEESDAAVVVVSEETGCISYVEKGRIKRNISSAELRDILQNLLIEKEKENGNKLRNKIANIFKKQK